jgi:hypothetical protein
MVLPKLKLVLMDFSCLQDANGSLTQQTPSNVGLSTEISTPTNVLQTDDDQFFSNDTFQRNNTLFHPMQCNKQFEFWIFIGGLFLGVAITTITLLCYRVHKEKKRASYSEPFNFDTFVNQ